MSIEANFARVHGEIKQAALAAGRDPEGVRLLVVSKTWPAEAIADVVRLGQKCFAENRVQEAQEKIPLLPGGLEWHLIGHLQANKTRKALPLFGTIHSVDSLDLARTIHRVASELGMFPKVYLQVNVAGEGQKSGFAPEVLRACLPEILALDRLEIQGLMLIPPYAADPEKSRPYFQMLRKLRDRWQEEFGVRLDGLSMGMSHDYAVAVAEGATVVRVGSAIFGERPKAPPA